MSKFATCPFCKNKECEAEFVDIGVGEIQSSPYICEKCGSYQQNPTYEFTGTEEERKIGWIKGNWND